jgi:hypothetical protein
VRSVGRRSARSAGASSRSDRDLSQATGVDQDNALRQDTARAVKTSRVLDDALRARWLELVVAMSADQLRELRSALEEAETRLDAADDVKRSL